MNRRQPSPPQSLPNMKNYSLKAGLVVLAALAVAACGQGVRIDGTIADAPQTQILVRQLNSKAPMDTITTGPQGQLSYKIEVAEGQPEFIYLYKGDKKLASFLVEKGEKVRFTADTLGNYSVEGSEGSRLLFEVERDFAAVNRSLQGLLDAGAPAKDLTKAYIDYYHNAAKFALVNCKSLAVVPLLHGNLGGSLPVFSQSTDALLFRAVCDSLKTVYPASKYVKALEKETRERENMLELRNRMNEATQSDFPELSLPGMDGKPVSLNGLFAAGAASVAKGDMPSAAPAKAVLVHFWDASVAAQKMFNLDVLKPLYEKWHSRGFEIYSVCLTPDKVLWASVVKNQELPWVNVNDGRGARSLSASLYNIVELPSSVLVAPGTVSRISGTAGLEKELARLLR